MKHQKSKLYMLVAYIMALCPLLLSSCSGTPKLRVNQSMQEELEAQRGWGPGVYTPIDPGEACAYGHKGILIVDHETHSEICHMCRAVITDKEPHTPERRNAIGYLIIEDRAYLSYRVYCTVCNTWLDTVYEPVDQAVLNGEENNEGS